MPVISDIILEKLNTLIVVVNSNGQVDYVSPSVQRVLGFETQQLLGEGWWNLTRNNEQERGLVRSHVAELMNQPSERITSSFERALVSSKGETKWVLWNTSKGPDDSLIGLGYDITDRKLAEQKLHEKNKELQLKNTDVLASIEYAKRIQDAVLPDIESIRKNFQDAFVLYEPKDVVSGDFYWYHKNENKIFVAAIDCTGHGVPGALMSVIANGVLRNVVSNKKLEEPSEILYELDKQIVEILSKENSANPAADGLDIALCVFDTDKKQLEFAGAFRPLIRIRNNVSEEFRGNRYPIGFYSDIEKKFETIVISYESEDSFYIFSDGYVDQFGGENEKKLNRKRFVELLLQVQNMNMEEQESFLDYALRNWKQELPQTDDILVIGLKV
jgi:PAS domain S-box-containing protein